MPDQWADRSFGIEAVNAVLDIEFAEASARRSRPILYNEDGLLWVSEVSADLFDRLLGINLYYGA